MASELSIRDSQNVSCFHKVSKSKWTDTALVTGVIALLVIGILASAGVFNFMGTANAAYLSYGMYVGAFLVSMAETIKLALNHLNKSSHSFFKPVTNHLKLSSPLITDEIENLKQNAKKYAQKKENYSPLIEKKIIQTSDGDYQIQRSSETEKQEAIEQLKSLLNEKIDECSSQQNPVRWLKNWEQERGGTEQLIIPDDIFLSFFQQQIKELLYKRAVANPTISISFTQEELFGNRQLKWRAERACYHPKQSIQSYYDIINDKAFQNNPVSYLENSKMEKEIYGFFKSAVLELLYKKAK